MAKKGQKQNNYDLNFINEVIEYKKCHSYTQTAENFSIPKGTVITWIYKYKDAQDIKFKQKGRPGENEIDYKERYEILKKLHDFYKSQIDKK